MLSIKRHLIFVNFVSEILDLPHTKKRDRISGFFLTFTGKFLYKFAKFLLHGKGHFQIKMEYGNSYLLERLANIRNILYT